MALVTKFLRVFSLIWPAQMRNWSWKWSATVIKSKLYNMGLMKILETEKISYSSKISDITFVCGTLGCRPCSSWFNCTGERLENQLSNVAQLQSQTLSKVWYESWARRGWARMCAKIKGHSVDVLWIQGLKYWNKQMFWCLRLFFFKWTKRLCLWEEIKFRDEPSDLSLGTSKWLSLHWESTWQWGRNLCSQAFNSTQKEH